MTANSLIGGRSATSLRPPAPTIGLIAKVVLLCGLDALALFAIPRLAGAHEWVSVVVVTIAAVALNVIYLRRRAIPAKYLAPGTVLLLAFLVYPIGYNVYTSFTNYGTGNVLTKSQAVEQILDSARTPDANAPSYRLKVLAKDDAATGPVSFLLQDPDTGQYYIGTSAGLAAFPSSDVTSEAGLVTAVKGYVALTIPQAQARKADVDALAVPATGGGRIEAVTFGRASVLKQPLRYDAGAKTMTDTTTGTVYREQDGTFTAANGKQLSPGWRVAVGWRNFAKAVTNKAIRGPFLTVLIWTFAFAVLSVVFSFAAGLLLALCFNHPLMRGRRIYRSVIIIPYALPSFLSALVWQAMLNSQFGVVNSLTHLHFQWLLDPNLAKVSVLVFNTWLGFPYMFLIATGALQGIPSEFGEAARVDGASPFAAFRRITFPLLLVSVAPLLVLSFSYNFNNFNTIYLLTGGGPPIAGAQTPAGHTDILISYTYRLAFESGRGNDWAFACAISVLIFILVALFSLVGFRFTKTFEEVR
jgi:arabinogalactan oligomer/maltooligosaccharide transport system permease protein